jgi:hypothetical protein
MRLKHNQISKIGIILFFTGLILIIISWHLSYPIYMPNINKILFNQFYPLIWPGMILSLLGLFFTGYYSEKKNVKILSASIFPIIIYVYVFFFSYIPTSDSGTVKAMFEIFHYTGINPAIESYFHYPIYFTLNEITSQILEFNANNLAVIYFMLFGFLIALYIYFLIYKLTKDNTYQIAFFAPALYFIAIFSYLNYQWVPQTLALIFLLILTILLNQKKSEYKFLSIIIFTVLVFTHLFIPAIFLLLIGIHSIKKKESRNIFLLMCCIYSTVLIYYATFFLPDIIEAFRESIYGFGKEYITDFSRSFKEPTSFLSNIISTINRIRIPIIWIILSIGFFLWFIKRKISFPAFALGLTGGIYFGVGMFYSILGMRALQILFIPLVIGIGFFLSKWRKLTLLLITIIIILSIFGPMRSAYDGYQFQINEEEFTCNFLANNIIIEHPTFLAMGGINSGYFLKKFNYANMNEDKNIYLLIITPSNSEFHNFFDTHLEKNEYLTYNSNLDKEVISYWINDKNANTLEEKPLLNNKIYECGKTFVVKGR